MTEDQAVALAKSNAIKKGWPWREPTEASLSRWRRRWTIRSNSKSIGVNVVTKIDDKTEQIIESHFLPR